MNTTAETLPLITRRQLLVGAGAVATAALIGGHFVEKGHADKFWQEFDAKLKPGSDIVVYDGAVVLKPGLNIRSTPFLEDPKQTGGNNLVRTIGEDKLTVLNPLIVSGAPTSRSSSEDNRWLAYFSPSGGKWEFAAWTEETIGRLAFDTQYPSDNLQLFNVLEYDRGNEILTAKENPSSGNIPKAVIRVGVPQATPK